MHPIFKIQSALVYRILFSCAIIMLLFVAGMSYKQIQALNETGALVVQSQKVHLGLEEVVSIMKDAETGQRGFIISNDSTFLEPYLKAVSKINHSLDKLDKLTAGNPVFHKDMDTLTALINDRLSILSTSLKINSKSTGPHDRVALKMSMISGKIAMDKIRKYVNSMVMDEERHLKDKERKHEHELQLTPFTSFLVVLVALFVFVLSYLKINSDVSKQNELNNKLQVNQIIFEHAENIAGISHWEWDFKKRKIHYSSNHYHLLRAEAKNFEIPGDFFNFIHPDDRDNIRKEAERVSKTHEASAAFFRVIRSDGELRYFKSIGKTIRDSSGNDIIIGVNIDVTEDTLNAFKMEQQNAELKRANDELASFNYIASHDLQEPLQKIQVFISRIYETELDSVSPKGHEYLSRIRASADRMQNMIEYLLMYSRTNKAEKPAEPVDLNILLEYAKQDLALLIEEKNVSIDASLLPTMKVIPQQIQQLMVNLIGNSIKYSKPGIPPKIQIHAEIVKSADVPNHYSKNDNKNFYKLSFIDNGIGFDQEYAESIFLLFKRLHDNSAYMGTGIGLAICKKIVENHHGTIVAEGVPDVGARFYVYLPV